LEYIDVVSEKKVFTNVEKNKKKTRNTKPWPVISEIIL